MNDEAAEIRASEAFRMIARRHRAGGLHLFATIAGGEGEPNRAWLECDGCAAVFEFAGIEDWVLVEEEEVSSSGPERVRHLAAAQA
jgi:hypothetical protein